MAKTVAKIEPGDESPLLVHTFRSSINENLTVKYQVIRFNGSCLIWVGSSTAPKFSDLSLAMKSTQQPEPVASKILGGYSESPSVSMSTRLAKKLNKPVYVSFNIPGDRFIMEAIEKHLFDEIRNQPHVFYD